MSEEVRLPLGSVAQADAVSALAAIKTWKNLLDIDMAEQRIRNSTLLSRRPS